MGLYIFSPRTCQAKETQDTSSPSLKSTIPSLLLRTLTRSHKQYRPRRMDSPPAYDAKAAPTRVNSDGENPSLLVSLKLGS